jgi:hypothetical protein
MRHTNETRTGGHWMTDQDDATRLRELCEQASKEYDGDKLIDLVRRINELLDKLLNPNAEKSHSDPEQKASAWRGAADVAAFMGFLSPSGAKGLSGFAAGGRRYAAVAA